MSEFDGPMPSGSRAEDPEGTESAFVSRPKISLQL